MIGRLDPMLMLQLIIGRTPGVDLRRGHSMVHRVDFPGAMTPISACCGPRGDGRHSVIYNRADGRTWHWWSHPVQRPANGRLY